MLRRKLPNLQALSPFGSVPGDEEMRAAHLAAIEALGSVFGTVVLKLMAFFAQTYRDVFGFDDGPPLHDAVAMALAADPSICRLKRVRMDVELVSPLAAGQTVVDVWSNGVASRAGKGPNVWWAQSADVDAFWTLLLSVLQSCNKATPLNAGPPSKL